MAGEEALFALLADLEHRAEAAFDVERGLELLDRRQTEYASVTLAGRLMAGVGAPIGLEVRGVGWLHGRLERVAAD